MREKKIVCGKRYMEVDIIPRTIFQEKAVKGKRNIKKKESLPKQKNLNDKNSKRYVVQLINGNFNEGDLHVTCTYKDKYLPGTVEDAEKEATNFIRRINHRRKKKGMQSVKYVLITEYSISEEKIIRIHHHIVMEKGLSRDEIEELWSKRKDSMGYINADRLQVDENGLEAISRYLTKGRKKEKGKKKWSSSRNLIRPCSRCNDYKFSQRKIEKIIRDEDVAAINKKYPGYRITSVKTEYNDFFGWSMYLKMWKIDEEDLQ